MLVKSTFKAIILSSTFAILSISHGYAADLPSGKSNPIEYVRVCSSHGQGFFYVPGTDTCLRVSGRVRAEYRYNERFSRADDVTGFRARGRLNIDARTQTAYGTLRAYARYELTGDTGAYGSALTSVNQTKSLVEKAFIQFAGITAGRTQSFFDFYADEYNWQDLRGSDNYSQNLLAYTFTFGSGFSATLSLEDAVQRRAANLVQPTSIIYAGERMPDMVGALRVDQSWGSLQISAALHQLQSLNTKPAVGGVSQYVDTEYGFALQGGFKVNLPMLATGSAFSLQGTYVNGAIGYLTAQHLPLSGSATSPALTTGYVSVSNSDAYVNGVGQLKTTKGYAITGALLHYWMPQVRQSFFTSYMHLDYANSVSSPIGINGAAPAGAIVDQNEWRIGSNIIWSPVKGLDIGMETIYVHLDPKGRITTNVNYNPVVTKTVSSDGAWEARLRIQRDF